MIYLVWKQSQFKVVQYIYKKNGSIGGSTVLIKLEEIDWL